MLSKKLMLNDIGENLKAEIEKMNVKAQQMAMKDSLNRHYRGQIEGLNNQIEVLVEEKRKLLEDNAAMQKLITDFHIKRNEAPLTPSPAKTIKTVTLTDLPRGSAEKASKAATGFISAMQKGTMQAGLLECLTPLLQTLMFINKAPEFANVKEAAEENYRRIIPVEDLLILRKTLSGEFKGKLMNQEIVMQNISKYPQLQNPYMVNNVLIEDEFMRIIQNTFCISVYNYLSIPGRIQGKGTQVTELMVYMNKTNRRKGRANFGKIDEVLGQIISNFANFLGKYDRVNSLYEREKELKAFTYIGAEELLSCYSMGRLMQIIEKQCKTMLHAERVNCVFYDGKRNEIYKRVRIEGKECIDSHPSAKGFASLCIHTLSSIISQNVTEDIRFCKSLDDPLGTPASPAIKVLAVPIMGKESKDGQTFNLPRGAIVAVNKENNADFTHEDVDNITFYNCLAAKIFDITTYFSTLNPIKRKLEYFMAMGGQIEKLGNQTVNLINTMEGTNTYFTEIDKQFTGMKSLFEKQSKH